MNEKNNFALVPRPSGALEKVHPGAKRILSGMVADTLALAPKEQVVSPSRKFRIGDYEWREPDHQQILLWAKALGMEPQEVVQRLLTGKSQNWNDTIFADGSLVKVNWDFELLPIEMFEWVDRLVMTHLAFSSPPEKMPNLALRLPLLTHLSFTGFRFNKLDLSAVPKLESLRCDFNELTSLDLSAVPLLRWLHCERNKLTEMNLSSVPLLEVLHCEENRLTSLDLSAVPLLRWLQCEENKLTDLDMSNVPLLGSLYCWGNKLTSLNLPGNPLLKELHCGENQIAQIDLSCVPWLTALTCDVNKLTSLNLSGVPRLWFLSCGENQLTALDLSPVANLTTLDCGENTIPKLDIRPLLGLKRLTFDRNKTQLKRRSDQKF